MFENSENLTFWLCRSIFLGSLFVLIKFYFIDNARTPYTIKFKLWVWSLYIESKIKIIYSYMELAWNFLYNYEFLMIIFICKHHRNFNIFPILKLPISLYLHTDFKLVIESLQHIFTMILTVFYVNIWVIILISRI